VILRGLGASSVPTALVLSNLFFSLVNSVISDPVCLMPEIE